MSACMTAISFRRVGGCPVGSGALGTDIVGHQGVTSTRQAVGYRAIYHRELREARGNGATSGGGRVQRSRLVSVKTPASSSWPASTSARPWLLICPPKLVDTGNAGRDHVRCLRQQLMFIVCVIDLHVAADARDLWQRIYAMFLPKVAMMGRAVWINLPPSRHRQP
jgi:hypothetical protein